jgi:hypothetical protein
MNTSRALLEEGQQLTIKAFRILGRRWSPDNLDNTAFSGAILAPYSTQTFASADALVDWITSHDRKLRAIIEAAETSADARAWLSLLAESGRRWPALVPTAVPIGQPFIYKTREVRSSGDRRSRVFRHKADLTSAQSYHIAVGAPDPAMRIRRPPEAVAEDREQIGAPEVFESFTWSDELFAAYSSLPSRPEQAAFTFSFGLHRGVWLPYVYATLLVLGALYAALTRRIDPAIAAVLTIPTTIVGGFLVSRDSVLVARFLQWPRLFLMATNLALWIVVLWKLSP